MQSQGRADFGMWKPCKCKEIVISTSFLRIMPKRNRQTGSKEIKEGKETSCDVDVEEVMRSIHDFLLPLHKGRQVLFAVFYS